MLYSPREIGSWGMVRRGLFAVLGFTVELAGGRAYISFLLGRPVALLPVSRN